jgi:3-deoxy-7-phosphoheptulonate synthase
MIEVHPDPRTARSDADQALTFTEFRELMRQVNLCAGVLGRADGLVDHRGCH